MPPGYLNQFQYTIGHRTAPKLVRYGSRSYTKKRTVKIKGSVGFALLTVTLKNGTVTVALAIKNGMVKKNGKRYGHGTVRYEHGDKFGPPIVKTILKIRI